MKLENLQSHWERFAQSDPMWAILTTPGKQNGAWNRDEFFKTGEAQIGMLLQWVEREKPLGSAEHALDFGCGVGRLTQALAIHFQKATGVDISPTMVALATDYNRHGDGCRYIANSQPHLGIFDDGAFDFVHSNITLQHIAPELSRQYLAEFCRILRPGGTLCFQLTDHHLLDRVAIRRWIRRAGHAVFVAAQRLRGKPVMEMHAIPEAEVRRILDTNGVDVIATRDDGAAGPHWRSIEYIARKRC